MKRPFSVSLDSSSWHVRGAIDAPPRYHFSLAWIPQAYSRSTSRSTRKRNDVRADEWQHCSRELMQNPGWEPVRVMGKVALRVPVAHQQE